MPLIVPKKFKGKTLLCGDRAIVQQLHGRGVPRGTIARFSKLAPRRPQEPAVEMFYKYKIAKSLFPKNFIRVKGAFWGEPLNYGEVLLSEKSRLDVPSKRLIAKLRKMGYSDMTIGDGERLENSMQFKRHEERVEKFAKPVVEELNKRGIFVNQNPLNVWFDIERNPIFFDITFIDSAKINALANDNKKLTSLVQRHNFHRQKQPQSNTST